MHEESRGDRSGPDEEEVDAVFGVLSDARRRRVIRILRAREGPVSVTALAEALAADEPGTPDPDRLVVSLRHVHLPKLDATGVVEYVPERSRVGYDRRPLVERLLDLVRDESS
jgi:DNA-binding transcriptional ArsR family regulator